MEENLSKKIIELLQKHPEGLTIQQIANELGKSRITVTKYVFGLIGAGIVYQRKVGNAKLCYLKEKYVERILDEKLIEEIKKRMK
jgi:DNA-binding transcriptional ArsR family regulator